MFLHQDLVLVLNEVVAERIPGGLQALAVTAPKIMVSSQDPAIKPKNRIETMAVTFAAFMLNLLIKTVQMLPS